MNCFWKAWKKQPTVRKPDRRRQPPAIGRGMEQLEGRVMMAGYQAIGLHKGYLDIRDNGSSRANVVEVFQLQDTRIAARIDNSQLAVFPLGSVKGIRIWGDGGNDLITVGNIESFRLKSTSIWSGVGDDRIFVGKVSGKVFVNGGTGDDCITAIGPGTGHFRSIGSNGNDVINMFAWNGKTHIDARWGNDTVFGTRAGRDRIIAQSDRGELDATVAPGARFCIDRGIDRVRFYPTNLLPGSGVAYDAALRSLTIDLGAVPEGFDFRVAGAFQIELFWNEPWGRMNHVFDVSNLTIYFPPWGADVTIDGFQGSTVAYGNIGNDTLRANGNGPVEFHGDGGNDTLIAAFTPNAVFFAQDGVVGNDAWPTYNPAAGNRWGSRDAAADSVLLFKNEQEGTDGWLLQGEGTFVFDLIPPLIQDGRLYFEVRFVDRNLNPFDVGDFVWNLRPDGMHVRVRAAGDVQVSLPMQAEMSQRGYSIRTEIVPDDIFDDLLFG